MRNIVTIGGSYGIGRSIAEHSIAEGNHVTIASRTQEDRLQDAAYIAFNADEEEPDYTGFPDEIDGLVYCPGSINLRPFGNLKAKDFHQDIQVNFFNMVRHIQGLMPRLKKSSDPSIVLFSTVAVQTGMPFHTSVAAAKGAVEGFARALAAEMAPKMRVNVIAPSLTDTPLASRLLANDRQRESAAERHPLKRVGQAQDIASAAAFLLGTQSSWMTGQVIHVDGGMSSLRV